MQCELLAFSSLNNLVTSKWVGNKNFTRQPGGAGRGAVALED